MLTPCRNPALRAPFYAQVITFCTTENCVAGISEDGLYYFGHEDLPSSKIINP